MAFVAVLVLTFCGCGGGGETAAEPSALVSCDRAIPASQAWDHRLETVAVTGVVKTAVPNSELYDGATLELAETRASETGLTVIIPHEDRGKFPYQANFYVGKTICVAGLIGGYQPTNMVVDSPDQIAIIETRITTTSAS